MEQFEKGIAEMERDMEDRYSVGYDQEPDQTEKNTDLTR